MEVLKIILNNLLFSGVRKQRPQPDQRTLPRSASGEQGHTWVLVNSLQKCNPEVAVQPNDP